MIPITTLVMILASVAILLLALVFYHLHVIKKYHHMLMQMKNKMDKLSTRKTPYY